MSLADSNHAVDPTAECSVLGVSIDSVRTFYKKDGHKICVRRTTPREEEDVFFLQPENEPEELNFE